MTEITVRKSRTAPKAATLTRTQAKLFLREPANVFFAILFPVVILVGVGFILPGMREVMDDAGPFTGLRPIDIYLPAVLALAVGTIGLTTFPQPFALYREKGVLRRLKTTPMPASRLLTSEMVVNLGALAAGVAVALGVGFLALDLQGPNQPLVVLAVFVLGAAQLMALGCLIAAFAPTGGVANVVSMSVYFPMLFFAGVWLPGPAMPDALQTIATYVPLGALAQGLMAGWYQTGFPLHQVVVMAAWTAVAVPLSVKLFRWT